LHGSALECEAELGGCAGRASCAYPRTTADNVERQLSDVVVIGRRLAVRRRERGILPLARGAQARKGRAGIRASYRQTRSMLEGGRDRLVAADWCLRRDAVNG